jgi:uncharacterized SAM-binding protein YcdF (DUF218 family)
MVLSQSEAENIAAYLELKSCVPEHAELIFVFGTWYSQPAEMAADLFQRGVAPRILVTGGSNKHTGVNEAEAHWAILCEAGVPDASIYVENQSANTLENVRLALPLIEGFLDQIQTILVIAKWQHSRRAVMTLKAHLPAGIRYCAQTYEAPQVPRQSWWQDAEAQRRVIGNWERIPRYLALGHLKELKEHGDCYV